MDTSVLSSFVFPIIAFLSGFSGTIHLLHVSCCWMEFGADLLNIPKQAKIVKAVIWAAHLVCLAFLVVGMCVVVKNMVIIPVLVLAIVFAGNTLITLFLYQYAQNLLVKSIYMPTLHNMLQVQPSSYLIPLITQTVSKIKATACLLCLVASAIILHLIFGKNISVVVCSFLSSMLMLTFLLLNTWPVCFIHNTQKKSRVEPTSVVEFTVREALKHSQRHSQKADFNPDRDQQGDCSVGHCQRGESIFDTGSDVPELRLSFNHSCKKDTFAQGSSLL